MNLEINKEIVFSSSHISKSDNTNLLLNYNDDFILYQYEYGFRIYVSEDLDKKCLSVEMSNAFWKLVKIAKDNGCKWLLLDCDGQTYKELEQFTW
jgi:hypothetical protein